MTTIKALYDGEVFVPIKPVPSVKVNQEAIITLLDKEDYVPKNEQLLDLAGSISHEDYLEIEKALEDTEKVFSNEW
jgi:hypothetical protein